MTPYTDIYMRDDKDDVGIIPDPSRVYWQSPDIIPYGTSPFPGNFQQAFAGNFGDDVGQPIVAGQINYVYVRGMNGATGPASGTVQLYYADSSLLLQTSQWINNVVMTANNVPTTAVSDPVGGHVVVGADAFEWSPSGARLNSHFCLIALVGTPAHPAPVPAGDFATSAAFVEWLLDNPGAVQRNVTMVPTKNEPSWQQSQTFANLDPGAEEYLFQADISSCPAGTTVSFSCSASGPQPPIAVSMTVPPNPPAPLWLSTTTELPAGFASSLVLTITVPEGGTMSGRITVDYARVTTERDEPGLRASSRPLAALFPGADGGDLTVTVLGSCTVEFI